MANLGYDWTGRDRIGLVYSHSAERARAFADRCGIPRATCDLAAATAAPEVGVVVIGLPHDRHREAAELAAAAGKAVLCTKPLARSADEARAMLAAVERAGVFHGYLEDLVYTPKTLKALQSVAAGSIGKVLWARSREAHGGPHSAWFWDRARSGGGAIVDLGCHCIEIARRFIGSDVRPLEVTCWADTQAHPIEAEDHAVGLVRYESGALGQFELSCEVDGVTYKKYDGIWYSVELEHYDGAHYYTNIMGHVVFTTRPEVRERRKQLSKRELKRLDLKND